jgi:hypothetical protein
MQAFDLGGEFGEDLRAMAGLLSRCSLDGEKRR